MFIAAGAAVIIAMAIAIVRLILGPTVYDRILAVNVFGSKALLLIAVHGFLTDRPEFMDIALVIALMKFFKFAHLGQPHSGDNLGDL